MSVRFPWPVLESPVEVTLIDVRLDGRVLPEQCVDGDHLRVDLDGVEGWDVFECEISVATDGGVPPGLKDMLAYAVVSAPATNVRVPFRLEGDPPKGRVAVGRADVAERFMIGVDVAARVGDRYRVIGTGPVWTIVLDRRAAPVPPGVPPFETVWVDFTSAEAPLVARRNPDAHAVMDLENEPRLLLNDGIDGFQALLHTNRPKPDRHRLQEVLATGIARYAVATMFRAAAAEIVDEDGEVHPPERELFRQVCEAVAERMVGIGSVDELYKQLADPTVTAADNADLWGRVDAAIDALTDVSTTVAKICEAVKYA